MAATERDQIGCVHWNSQRFNSDPEEEFPSNFHFYPDEKARPAHHEDHHGFVVGETSPITESDNKQLIVLFDSTVTTLHPSRVLFDKP